jgi:hypothetical protein
MKLQHEGMTSERSASTGHADVARSMVICPESPSLRDTSEAVSEDRGRERHRKHEFTAS